MGLNHSAARKAIVAGLGLLLAFGTPAGAIAAQQGLANTSSQATEQAAGQDASAADAGKTGTSGADDAESADGADAAASAGKGYVLIHAAKGNEGVTYSAMKIFKADVQDSSVTDASEAAAAEPLENITGKLETNIEWASDAMQTAISTVILANGGTADDVKTPQNAALWLERSINSDSADAVASGNGTRSSASSIATQISIAANSADVTAKQKPAELKDGVKSQLDSGIWMITTKDDSIKENQTGTSPILAVMGGGIVTISEKASVPSLTKEVQEDSTGEWGKTADNNIGDFIPYRLTGTLPDNYVSYSTYYYEFSDHLSEGLTADKDSVKVSAVNGKETKDITDSFEITYGKDNTLHVVCEDLKQVEDVTATTKIVVNYMTTLNSKAEVGSQGNPNTVELIYTKNPNQDGHGETTPQENIVYTYSLDLVKLDANNLGMHLEGAKFTLQAEDGSYVQADGSLKDTKHEFTTDSDGHIDISGLDAGTYRLEETEAPAGYEKVGKAMSITITSAMSDTDSTLTSLTAALMGNEKASITATSVAEGEVNLQVLDSPTPPGGSNTEKIPNLGTGLGAWIALASGAALVGFGGYQIHRKHKADDGKQE